jgi:hypothetical protein
MNLKMNKWLPLLPQFHVVTSKWSKCTHAKMAVANANDTLIFLRGSVSPFHQQQPTQVQPTQGMIMLMRFPVEKIEISKLFLTCSP